jgi:hypothetical protein
MPRFAQGTYQVVNAHKYVGQGMPRYRSSWEQAFMRFCDFNDHVLQWASESVRIPYRHPITGRMTTYVPDFLITYRTRDNTMRGELIEIKPSSQSVIAEGQNPRDRAIVAVNYAKWHVATLWAKQHGLTFRIITEADLFVNGKR